ncbi:hypothetical protein JAAARDRAFT_189845 [Jaapia argillacea MUCL 33604]|uniref:Midasin n=1 Tax=Jaapia argillacea MUCL 33604 TaxID=933084 RepID=A0A067QIU7_9AGAM|nr:hypothetical protein JAAARDRAFT_189845 [Jaapia argillacea MUCL 33604]
MSSERVFFDPLTINLKKQTLHLLSLLPAGSVHAALLQQVSSRSDLLHVLSRLLLVPSLTLAVAAAFRPLLIDLCARWLLDGEQGDEKFTALALLLEPHEELFPILIAFLRRHIPRDGPLAIVLSTSAPEVIDAPRLHRLLLAYYRVLKANGDIPKNLYWPLSPLSKLFWTPHPDTGVRLLAIRCYALHTDMAEVERIKIEKEVLGEICGVDCPVAYGESIDGKHEEVDGWMLEAIEMKRVGEARYAIGSDPTDFYSCEEPLEPIHPSELSHLIVNVHGILFLHNPLPQSSPSTLISTPTTVQSLRDLALHLSLRLPTLLTSSPSSGKSLLLSHLAHMLHPGVANQLITIQLADTSLDPRSLLGSYTSSPTRPRTFEWREGVLVRAMREGKWVVFKDIDRASAEVLGIIKPLVESLGLGKPIGARALISVPNREVVEADEEFAIFATRSVAPMRGAQRFPAATFFGSHKFAEVFVPQLAKDEIRMIIDERFPRLVGVAASGIISLWEAVKAIGSTTSTRDIGLRELEKFCTRIDKLLPASYQPMSIDIIPEHEQPALSSVFPNPTLREDIYLEARDVFFGAGGLTTSARSHLEAVSAVVGDHLGLTPERQSWVLKSRVPEFDVEKDVNGRTVAVRAGRARLPVNPSFGIGMEGTLSPARGFAMHKPAVMLLSRISTAVSLAEPVLLTGETGTGKTSVVTHLASILHRPLISLNLSNQTESSDLLGGFKPVDARVPGSELQSRFLNLFGETFSRKKNAKFEEAVRRAVAEMKWKRAVGLWKEATRMAKDRLHIRSAEEVESASLKPVGDSLDSDGPRKRRKVEERALTVSLVNWDDFERDVEKFDVQFVQGKGKFAFGFVEGPLVKALRSGHWILLDEINLASPETLECISSLLHSPTGSITLTEQGALEPVPRHPDFRLFACMNPATDVGKKDLPPHIRSRLTEIDVPPPDADLETLLSIVTQYIGPCAVGDKGAIMDVAEFYIAVKNLAEDRRIADGANHRPHYSMRTLARALTFASDVSSTFGLRRALWEGCLMAFTMVLDAVSAGAVTVLAQKHILAGVKNVRSLLARLPTLPRNLSQDAYVKFGPFYLEKGPLPDDVVEDYIMTPSVETKLVDLARIVTTRRFPVLIEGPTSSGKTSSIEYLAKRTGHRFVRINNHEHTDIQEYLGTYVSDPVTGKLIFKDGLLVRALRNGDWIVLDELNLAPSDVLEALNRLLDDNRELVIPETQEVVRPHPHFMLFATQNPPGLYAGRKVLSRAFRNRFLEVHFADVPQTELETILCQRCRIAPPYSQRIVSVFQELQKRRQSGRVFESKQGFATLRDLFRWAGRDALGYQELAENGYMLLAERARRDDDRAVVKEVIESIMKVRIDETALYAAHSQPTEFSEFLDCHVPSSSHIVWTTAMQRLFVLVSRALRFNEPVLLVGDTGSGKTSVCQLYAEVVSKHLHSVNCHQNTETADLIGGLRPVRNRAAHEAETLREASMLLQRFGFFDEQPSPMSLISAVDRLLESSAIPQDQISAVKGIRSRLQNGSALFEWHDGPLVESMRKGDVFLLDEISLADDSVLERLNSVLEPGRTIVLAEKGGDDHDGAVVLANQGFKLVATMNPGGDYGKKELSPALRNRFTEIWVPHVDDRHDLEKIIGSLFQEALAPYTRHLLDFVEWLCERVGDRSLLSLRDILAWVSFSNAVFSLHDLGPGALNEIFHHAAHMTFLDGLASLPQLANHSREAIQRLRIDALAKLEEIVPFGPGRGLTHLPTLDHQRRLQIGPFSIPKGTNSSIMNPFNLQAPTTLDNATRVIRACQVNKPILLEGSPGVGKTSLITALASMAGFHLCRINLSDQTDLIDLFGSDLPVEGGQPGEFAWRDAEFLKAMQDGEWVLLDEMNLAPQAVLEGLNAVLDHRGTVFIPELGRTFTRHPAFRIFAAQNPLQQGGGRKGLPRSFVNRFTKVYIEELSPNDLILVCHHLFPDYSQDMLQAMIAFNSRLNHEMVLKPGFAREGRPWEFNLRDVIRWATPLRGSAGILHPLEYLQNIYLQRFRTVDDREHAGILFEEVFGTSPLSSARSLRPSISPDCLRIGHFTASRNNTARARYREIVLQSQLAALQAAGTCLMHGWLVILTGPRNAGKTSLARLLARLSGNDLDVLHLNNATDTSDLLGTFEQADPRSRAMHVWNRLLKLRNLTSRTTWGSQLPLDQELSALAQIIRCDPSSVSIADLLASSKRWLDDLRTNDDTLILEANDLRLAIQRLTDTPDSTGRFEWVDGPLITALKTGRWLLLDGSNLCNPSVLDRLNSLCEQGGVLTLSERGQVDGQAQVIKPHPGFRLFMSLDPQLGELSRAMRNRGIEIALSEGPSPEDWRRLEGVFRLPSGVASRGINIASDFEGSRRGIGFPVAKLIKWGWPSNSSLGEDSQLSSLIERIGILSIGNSTTQASSHSYVYVAPLVFGLSSSRHLSRFLATFAPLHSAPRLLMVERVIKELCSHRPLCSLLVDISKKFGREWRVPSDFMYSQPLDLYVNSSLLYICEDQTEPSLNARAIMLILHLFATTLLCNPEEPSEKAINLEVAERTGNIPTQRVEKSRALRAAQSLSQAILAEGSNWLCGLEEPLSSAKVNDLEVLVRIEGFARFLRSISQASYFDFSAAYAIVRWISCDLAEPHSDFPGVVYATRLLEDAVCPTSGLGMTEIWTELSRRTPSLSVDDTPANGVECDHADGTGFNNWLRMLRLASQDSLTPASVGARVVSSPILSQVGDPAHQDTHIHSSSSKTRELQEACGDSSHSQPHDPSMIAVELGVIVDAMKHLGSGTSQIHGEDTATTIETIITFASLEPSQSLTRFVPHQHVTWALRAQKLDRSVLFPMLKKWLNAVWSISLPNVVVEGPAVLLHPVELQSTLQQCDLRTTPLALLDHHRMSVDRQRQLINLQSQGTSPRVWELTSMMLQSVSMISSCFATSFDTMDFERLQVFSASPPQSSASIDQFLDLLGRTSAVHLRSAIERFLHPALHHLFGGSRFSTIDALGRSWLALGQLILDLYVPDTPLDPDAIQQCSTAYVESEGSLLSQQFDLHRDLENHLTGTGHNGITSQLGAWLETLQKRFGHGPSPSGSGPREVSKLHAFWSEVSQFLFQVMMPTKLHSLLDHLGSNDLSAFAMEKTLQDSMAGFIHRLTSVYPTFSDISGPIEFAILSAKMGLRLVADSSRQISQPDALSSFASALVAYPSVKSAANLRKTPHLPYFGSSQQHLLLRLSALEVDVSTGVDLSSLILALDDMYGQALGLWNLDGAKKLKAEEESQSLYRQSRNEHRSVADEEIEEQEFLTMFPNFEESPESSETANATNPLQSPHVINDALPQSILSVHFRLMGVQVADSSRRSKDLFTQLRRASLENLLSSSVGSLPDTIDFDGLAYQLNILRDHVDSFDKTTSGTNRYDFYADGNVLEAQKAAVIVGSLRGRLLQLIQEWPDQMVLQHLSNRCDMVLHLGLSSPIARLLPALEQLLVQSEDWEMYANRENTLRSHQHDLTQLIVDWRRLELACWQQLLEAQATNFANEASHWWFRLYEAIVRGALSVLTEASGNPSDAVGEYLDSLTPLLDDFVTSSPLGQYERRLELLGSFEHYVQFLSFQADGHRGALLQRLHRLLYHTGRFYRQFSSSLLDSLSQQRTKLEKEIQEFIKLASWKDINVQALKQSAQRSHRQLYKTIRKFRDVLRKPTTLLLRAPKAGDAETQPLELNPLPQISIALAPLFPVVPPPSAASTHLLDLDRTYHRFHSLIASRIESTLEANFSQSVDELAVDIIVTSQNLGAITIPSNLPAPKRDQQQKSLLLRKRKALSDLLKELKRLGLSANVPPDVLHRQQHTRWIREQPIPTANALGNDKVEVYLNRLLALLPELRMRISDHHADISTRELQRGVGFLESGFGYALKARAGSQHHVFKLQETSDRLHAMVVSAVAGSGNGIYGWVTAVRECIEKTTDALNELLCSIGEHGSLANLKLDGTSIVSEVRSAALSSATWSRRVSEISAKMKSTKIPLLLRDEHGAIFECSNYLSTISLSLSRWSQDHDLRHLFEPVRQWLASFSLPSCPALTEVVAGDNSDQIIDGLLIRVQALLLKLPSSETDIFNGRTDPDNHIRDSSTLLCGMTDTLKLDALQEQLDSELKLLFYIPQELAVASIGRFLPFLDRYLNLAKLQIEGHRQWTRAMFKLEFVLCTVLLTLAKEGYCKPPDVEGAGGDGEVEGIQGQDDGLGLGEGTGAKDVSKEIEDESQVEGLGGENADPDAENDLSGEDDAVEMTDDFGGEMQNMSDDGSQDDPSDDEGKEEHDERIGEVDEADSSAVDEKLWGDEAGPEDDIRTDKKTTEDHSTGQDHPSEVTAKEHQQNKKKEDPQGGKDEDMDAKDDAGDDYPLDSEEADPDPEAPNSQGAPVDDYVQEAETLDLPEDMDLVPENEMKEDGLVDEDASEISVDESQEGRADEPNPQDEDEDEDAVEENLQDNAIATESGEQDDGPEDSTKEEGATAQPDLSTGQDGAQSVPNQPQDQDMGSSEDATGGEGQAGGQSSEATDAGNDESDARPEEQLKVQNESTLNEQREQATSDAQSGQSHGGTATGPMPQPMPRSESDNARSLGDASKEIRQRFKEIQDSSLDERPREQVGTATEETEFEYLRQDDVDHDMQGLGPAGEEKAPKLSDLNIIDEDHLMSQPNPPMDIDPPMDHEQFSKPTHSSLLKPEETAERLQKDVESALTRAQVHSQDPSQTSGQSLDMSGPKAEYEFEEEQLEVEEAALEAELRTWQAQGQPEESAEHLWRLYQSLTHDLSYALCEQLRLILEPTQATRLKGDYRTGKRLNMKKIIPYIASEYTKDKIWLRRTMPSQREYQVLISLDDSRSMSESHSVHLAYQTLALVSKALGKLEVGDIGIAKFGESVELLHGFDGGPFTDQTGIKVMSAFHFNQKATNVLSLLETSLKVLEAARERRSSTSSTAADLWQLEIIISDGICQDHQKLRTILRKAEEQRVMIVFVIIDSLHSHTTAASGPSASGAGASSSNVVQNSILSMKQVAYKNVDGRMELQMERYLDSFPFEYYVVLRDVEALPEVLSGTLKQFFERISEE